MNQHANNTYNGWTNYETWAVNLRISNERSSCEFWTRRTQELLADSPKEENWRVAVELLSAELCEAIKDECVIEKASLASDLMNAALGEVDWHEIAQALIDEALTPKHEEKAAFSLGLVVATPGAMEQLNPVDRMAALARHSNGDWGDACPEDWAENELSLKEGFRLFSIYHSKAGVKFWIITEADRSATTILLPEEY